MSQTAWFSGVQQLRFLQTWGGNFETHPLAPVPVPLGFRVVMALVDSTAAENADPPQVSSEQAGHGTGSPDSQQAEESERGALKGGKGGQQRRQSISSAKSSVQRTPSHFQHLETESDSDAGSDGKTAEERTGVAQKLPLSACLDRSHLLVPIERAVSVFRGAQRSLNRDLLIVVAFLKKKLQAQLVDAESAEQQLAKIDLVVDKVRKIKRRVRREECREALTLPAAREFCGRQGRCCRGPLFCRRRPRRSKRRTSCCGAAAE